MERHGRTVGSADLNHLAGKAIKLCILLEKARLYSLLVQLAGWAELPGAQDLHKRSYLCLIYLLD